MTASGAELGVLVAAGALATAAAHLAYFPAVLFAARRRPRPWSATGARFDGRLALLVPARDEEETIRGKLENLLGDPSLPPGSLVVVLADGCRDRTVKLWEFAGGEARTVGVHLAAVRAVAFLPQSDLLASGSADRTVRVW